MGLNARFAPFLLGFLATAFQIYLLREFDVHFYGNELTFGLVLGAWLLWGGVGSLLRQKAGRLERRLAPLYTLTIGLFFAVLVLLRFSHRLLGVLPGELTGLGPALGFALVLSAFVSLPLGALFVTNAALLGGDSSRVYLYESLGAAAAGLAVQFFLIPRVSNWQGAALVAAAAGLAIFLVMNRKGWLLFAATVAVSGAFVLFDLPTQKSEWRPFDLAASEDTPYGRLQAVRSGDQISFYANGLAAFSYPDPAAAEEAVHFALLQRPEARRVLLIGGGPAGCLEEILKYPEAHVDYVELDPEAVRLAARLLPESARSALEDQRVRRLAGDGRAWLEKTAERYDAVLLDLPGPATAQINRFYTREFFAAVKKKLAGAGILSFVVPSAENYISRDLQRFLSSLYESVRGVFPEVAVVPGATCVFLASTGPISTEPAALEAAIARLGLRTSFVAPGMLEARLDPGRMAYLREKLAAGSPRLNRDLAPVSYYFHSVIWASQFKGIEAHALGFLSGLRPFWVLDFPLVLAVGAMTIVLFRRRTSPGWFLLPVAVMGLTSIVVEMAVLIAFQATFGYVYGRISLLLASFMAGLFLGALLALRRARPSLWDLASVQAGFCLLLTGTVLVIGRPVRAALPFACLLAFGVLGGYLFVTANRLFLRNSPRPGLAYGLDLLGSFLGVIAASSLIIPLFGIRGLLVRLAVLNAFALAFSLAASRRSSGAA